MKIGLTPWLDVFEVVLVDVYFFYDFLFDCDSKAKFFQHQNQVITINQVNR